MPLSKKRDQERKRLSRLESASVQPKQAKIKELRNMVQDISLRDAHLADDDWLDDELPQDIDLAGYNIPDIDADGNLIPDF